MSVAELNFQLEKFNKSTTEEIFGSISGSTQEMLDSVSKTYRILAKSCHPDVFRDNEPLAQKVFDKLKEHYNKAELKIKANKYGVIDKPKSLIVKKYEVQEIIGKDSISNLYKATKDKSEFVFKIVRNAANNGLLKNEIEALKIFTKKYDFKTLFFPSLIDSFMVDDGKSKRQVVIYPYTKDVYSLAEVMKQYPDGLDPRDAAWMFNRIAELLTLSHSNGLIHNAVFPENILIHPASHSGILINWAFSSSGQPLKIIDETYKDWYPVEITSKLKSSPASDIYMAAKCMIYILGDKYKSIPKEMNGILNACLIASPFRRINDALGLRDSFGKMLREVYGPPNFRPFTMKR